MERRGKTDGLSPRYYTESVTLYVAPVCGDLPMQMTKHRDALRSIQPTIVIRVSRTYRTVSTESLLVSAKMLPRDLLAGLATLHNDHDLTVVRPTVSDA